MERELRKPSKGLFKQFNKKGIYDLDEWHDVFLRYCDPTCYGPALELVGTWKEWNRIVNDWPEFKNHILASWLEEVEIKLRSTSIVCLATEATSGGKGAGAAARWIAEGRYAPKKAGRPTKAEVTRQAKLEAGVVDEVAEDISRVLEATNMKAVN